MGWGGKVQRKPDLGDRCKPKGILLVVPKIKVQRKPDLGDRCKDWLFVSIGGNPGAVQRKPDLGDRCKSTCAIYHAAIRPVQRKPDLGDRCKSMGRWFCLLTLLGATET